MGRLRNIMNDIIYGNKITFIIRVSMGALFVFSGYFKVFSPDAFAKVIENYNILPALLVPYGAVVIPYLEVLVGLFLIIGLKVRASALVSMALMVMFIVFIGVNVVKGRSFECGCFSVEMFGLRVKEYIGVKMLIRDAVFLVALVLIFMADRHLFSIENLMVKYGLKDLR